MTNHHLKKTMTLGAMRDWLAEQLDHPANQVRLRKGYNKELCDSSFDSFVTIAEAFTYSVTVELLDKPADDTKEHAMPEKDGDGGAGDDGAGDDGAGGDGAGDGAAASAPSVASEEDWATPAAGWAALREIPEESSRMRLSSRGSLKGLDSVGSCFGIFWKLLQYEGNPKLVERVWNLVQLLPENEVSHNTHTQ